MDRKEMKYDIIHVIPKKFPYGAYAMLDELHFALDMHYSDKVNQSVYHLLQDKGNPEHFALNSTFVRTDRLLDTVKRKYSNPVIIFHKLAATNCLDISKAVYNKIPFIIINHTQTSSFSGIAPCNRLVCVSKHMIKSARSRIPSYKRAFVRNGVNACRYDNIKAVKPDEVNGFFVTGRLNNLNNCKHPADWIPFVRSIDLSIPLWHDYVGSGRHSKEAANQAGKKGRGPSRRNHVNLTGRIDIFDEKVAYIKRWDTFFYEIRGKEGTSMSLLESMACGVPALINNKPGNMEIIENGVNGFVYETRADAIKWLKDMSSNPNKLSDIKASTKELFLEKYDAEHMARDYVQVITEMLDEF